MKLASESPATIFIPRQVRYGDPMKNRFSGYQRYGGWDICSQDPMMPVCKEVLLKKRIVQEAVSKCCSSAKIKAERSF
jgi:hypothetical protein